MTASRVRTRADEDRDPWGRVFLFVALGVGLVRFFRLSEWSLWIDEALALSDSLHGGEFNNPLGYWLFRFLFQVWEGRPDEFALRLLPAILGWLGIPLTYWAFRPLAGRRAAAGAALILAVSSWHVYWSQTARFYTLAQDLSLLGSALVIRGLWQDEWRKSVAGFLLAGLAALAHPSAASLLPALVFAPAVLRLGGRGIPSLSRRSERVLYLVSGVAVLAALPWAVDVWERWQLAKGGGTPVHFVLTVGFHFTPLLGAAALVGGLMAWQRRAAFECYALVVTGLVIGTWILIAALARASAQYVFYMLPWVALLAASPLSAAPRPRLQGTSGGGMIALVRRLQVAYVVLLVLPMFADTVLYFTARGGNRPRWRDAYRYVWNQREPGDLIMGMEAPVGEYYLTPDRTDVRYQRNVTYLNNVHPEWIDLWTQRERRTWFVVNFGQLDDWPAAQRHDFERLLREDCLLVNRFPIHAEGRDLSIAVFLRE